METSINITMLVTVAEGLSGMLEDVVFVGGAVVGLYVTHAAAPEIRPTDDVDCVVEVSSRLEYNQLEERLRKLGFLNDATQGAPICRWKYKGVTVDVMPTDPNILGFSNMWYDRRFSRAMDQSLPDGTTIKILSPPYFIGSKIEAYKSRGAGDMRTSTDFEDLVYVLDNRDEIVTEVAQTDKKLRQYLHQEFQSLLGDSSIDEGIASVLPYDTGASRVAKVKQMMRLLAS